MFRHTASACSVAATPPAMCAADIKLKRFRAGDEMMRFLKTP
jgi:hypothetical protein